MKKTALVTLALIFLTVALPSAALANSNKPNTNVFLPTILNGPLIICVGSTTAVPSGGTSFPTCNNLCDLVAQIANIIYYAIGVVIWIIVPIFVAIGGIRIMLAGANPEMVGTGKRMITGAVWGLVICLLAWLIVSTFVTFLHISGVGGFNQSTCPIAQAPS